MGLKCLPDPDQRIILWRNTLQLFHAYKNQGFIGPFFSSDYGNYRVESPLSERETLKRRIPDIFACGPSGWLIIELTCDDESKKGQLDADKNLDPRSLSGYGRKAYSSSPDTISSRLIENNDQGHCQMVVYSSFILKNEEFINNINLRNALIETKGKDLTKLPEIPFSLVPEMKNFEIRRGLVDIVMQIFYEKSEGKTPSEMCEEGLERLFDLVSPSARQSLVDKIQQEMDVLIRTDLAGYIEYKDGKYRSTSKLKPYPLSRQVITQKLQSWANPTQRTIPDYNPL